MSFPAMKTTYFTLRAISAEYKPQVTAVPSHPKALPSVSHCNVLLFARPYLFYVKNNRFNTTPPPLVELHSASGSTAIHKGRLMHFYNKNILLGN
jgi:hypothetical protein